MGRQNGSKNYSELLWSMPPPTVIVIRVIGYKAIYNKNLKGVARGVPFPPFPLWVSRTMVELVEMVEWKSHQG